MIPKQVYNKWKAYVNESRGLVSSGILLYRKKGNDIEVYIVHAGGPYNENNRYAWGIPKGRIERGESAIDTAIREFEEEMGIGIPNEVSFDLGTIQTGSGKIVQTGYESDINGAPLSIQKIEIQAKNGKLT